MDMVPCTQRHQCHRPTAGPAGCRATVGRPVDTPDEAAHAIKLASPVSESASDASESHTLQHVTVNIGTISGCVSPNLVPTEAQSSGG
jgi:hypothetical protein